MGSTRFEGARGTRWMFTASGTVTNLAARLVGVAEGGHVVISPERPTDAWQIVLTSNASASGP